MTQHSPKTAALMAYESGALSQAGRVRLERHLRGCAACQRELATIQAYEATVDSIRDDRGPELDWSKMELALEREAQVQAKRHRRGWVLPAVGVMLAAAAAIVLAWPSHEAAPTTTIATAPTYVVDRQPPDTLIRRDTPDEATPRFASAVITLVAGASEVRGAHAVTTAATGARLVDGDVLATSETSSLHARLAPGLVIALEPSSTLRLGPGDLDRGDSDPSVTLQRGRLATHVGQTRTVFLAGVYRIEAEVASFVIDFDEESATLAVDVREGEVHVTGPSVDTRLTGPARFPEAGASLDASTPVGEAEGYDALPEVRAERAGIVRWAIGDVEVHGADQIAMRVGMGPITISGWDARGHLFRTTATVGADGLALTPDDLRPEAPRIHQGTLRPEQIVPVVRQHMRDLQRCYEHQLQTDRTLSVHIVARISVDMTGSVADDGVAFSGDAMPESMQRCMSNQMLTWLFPAPEGGPVTVPVPLAFAPES